MYRCTQSVHFVKRGSLIRVLAGRFLHGNSYRTIQRINVSPTSSIVCGRYSNKRSQSSQGNVEETINPGFVPGPSLQLGVGKMANLTHRSVLGNAGDTVVLATVSRDEEIDSDEPFLTVEYKQRTAAIGKFPLNARRSDSGRPSDAEILIGRAIDRSLRPVFDADLAHYHVTVTVQAVSDGSVPVVTALNSAVAALRPQLSEPVAATSITIMPDGTLLQESSFVPDAIGELLFVGTKDRVVMLEYTAITAPMPEDDLIRILGFAHQSIQPYLTTIEQLQEMSPLVTVDFESERASIRKQLGLASLPAADKTDSEDSADTDSSTAGENIAPRKKREEVLDDVVANCSKQLAGAINKLFGYTSHRTSREASPDTVYLHDTSKALLSKARRGLKEQVLHEEIKRQVDDYCNEMLIEFVPNGADGSENEGTTSLSERDRNWIYKEAIYRLFRQGLWETSFKHGTRADGRKGTKLGQGWKTIRPLSVTLPALPESVHGSSAFARGDTQVLCTVTLGAPSDGQPVKDPFRPEFEKNIVTEENEDEDKLPIGSLRFLKTQEAMESDLNSRKVKADKERTGDSGALAEVKRAFLQYDFPSYSTGTISKRKGGIDRRAIGHGSLAERAILPILPDKELFPYSIRMTSEVTDSNGSSSMASVCGASLALLDAGVPVKDLAAGVSVGLITDTSNNNDKPALLLDLTGTEDHYGNMDFKIAGTRSGVSAIQLDVKVPVELETLGDALLLAKSGRNKMIDVMEEGARKAFRGRWRRAVPKESAPRVEVVRFDPQRKRDLLGPGGIVVRQLEERYDVSIDLSQEGQCLLVGTNRELVQKAKSTIMDLVADVVEGEQYTGTVIEIKDFGAIVELLRNKEGLLHVSELSMDDKAMASHPEGSYGFVSRQLQVGQTIEVLCIGVDPLQGTAKLSRKALLQRQLEEQKLDSMASQLEERKLDSMAS